MKVLIWFGCIFVATILNTLMGYVTGFKIGYVIFYFCVYSAARRLCKKWDERKEAKKKQKELDDLAKAHDADVDNRMRVGSGNHGSVASEWKCVCGKSKSDAVEETNPNIAASQPSALDVQKCDQIRFCRKCGEKLIDKSRFCRICGTQVIEIVVSEE